MNRRIDIENMTPILWMLIGGVVVAVPAFLAGQFVGSVVTARILMNRSRQMDDSVKMAENALFKGVDFKVEDN